MSDGKQITPDEIKRLQELSGIISEFRKTLGPRKEAIIKTITTTLPMDEILSIMDFEGKTNCSYNFEYNDKPYTLKINLRKMA